MLANPDKHFYTFCNEFNKWVNNFCNPYPNPDMSICYVLTHTKIWLVKGALRSTLKFYLQ